MKHVLFNGRTARRWRSERGAALVEAALVLPLFALILAGTIDFGRVMYTLLAVQGAARAGAAYGTQSNIKAFDTNGIRSATTTAAADISGFTVTAPAAGSTPTCKCWDGSTETAMAACTSTCAGTVRLYVTVTGQKTFTTAVAYPAIPSSLTITRSVTMRAQ